MDFLVEDIKRIEEIFETHGKDMTEDEINDWDQKYSMKEKQLRVLEEMQEMSGKWNQLMEKHKEVVKENKDVLEKNKELNEKNKLVLEKYNTLVSELRAKVECPVCLVLPTEGPMVSCPKGHLVCLPCHRTMAHRLW